MSNGVRASDILAERSRRRMSQDELAAKTGIFRQTLVDIERNRIGIDDQTYNRIMNAIRDDEAEAA